MNAVPPSSSLGWRSAGAGGGSRPGFNPVRGGSSARFPGGRAQARVRPAETAPAVGRAAGGFFPLSADAARAVVTRHKAGHGLRGSRADAETLHLPSAARCPDAAAVDDGQGLCAQSFPAARLSVAALDLSPLSGGASAPVASALGFTEDAPAMHHPSAAWPHTSPAQKGARARVARLAKMRGDSAGPALDLLPLSGGVLTQRREMPGPTRGRHQHRAEGSSAHHPSAEPHGPEQSAGRGRSPAPALTLSAALPLATASPGRADGGRGAVPRPSLPAGWVA